MEEPSGLQSMGVAKSQARLGSTDEFSGDNVQLITGPIFRLMLRF